MVSSFTSCQNHALCPVFVVVFYYKVVEFDCPSNSSLLYSSGSLAFSADKALNAFQVLFQAWGMSAHRPVEIDYGI